MNTQQELQTRFPGQMRLSLTDIAIVLGFTGKHAGQSVRKAIDGERLNIPVKRVPGIRGHSADIRDVAEFLDRMRGDFN